MATSPWGASLRIRRWGAEPGGDRRDRRRRGMGADTGRRRFHGAGRNGAWRGRGRGRGRGKNQAMAAPTPRSNAGRARAAPAMVRPLPLRERLGVMLASNQSLRPTMASVGSVSDGSRRRRATWRGRQGLGSCKSTVIRHAAHGAASAVRSRGTAARCDQAVAGGPVGQGGGAARPRPGVTTAVLAQVAVST